MNTIRFYFEPIDPMDIPSKVAIQVAQWAAVVHIGQAMGFRRGRTMDTEVVFFLDCPPDTDFLVRFARRVQALGMVMENIFPLCICPDALALRAVEQLHLAKYARVEDLEDTS